MDSSLPRIDWLTAASHALTHDVPEVASECNYLTHKLAGLFLERLPPDLSLQMMKLLPAIAPHDYDRLWKHAACKSDASIGYISFVEKSQHALGVHELGLDESQIPGIACRMTESFLLAVIKDLPAPLKYQITDALPLDLRSHLTDLRKSA